MEREGTTTCGCCEYFNSGGWWRSGYKAPVATTMTKRVQWVRISAPILFSLDVIRVFKTEPSSDFFFQRTQVSSTMCLYCVRALALCKGS